MRIGEVADIAGVSTKTLRYYETIGLLAEPDRTPAGYRDYPKSVLDRLRFIQASQAVRLGLGTIRGIIAFRDAGQPPCGHVLQLIDGRADDLDDRIAELTLLRDALRRLARQGRLLSPEACSPDLVCHIINPGGR